MIPINISALSLSLQEFGRLKDNDQHIRHYKIIIQSQIRMETASFSKSEHFKCTNKSLPESFFWLRLYIYKHNKKFNGIRCSFHENK